MKFLTALLLTLLVAGAAQAHSFKSGDLRIGHPWAKPTLDQGSQPTAEGPAEARVYLSFLDQGDKTDQLQGASTSIATKAVLMQQSPDGALAETNGIDLPTGRGVTLRPNGSYIKLTGLKGGLTAGDKFTLRLKFAVAPPVDVIVFVQDEPTETMTDHGGMSHMEMNP